MKDYVEILSALLTPTIAIITTYIAIQQYRSGRAKFRHELYDRRMAVYKATSTYLSLVLRNRQHERTDEERAAYSEFVKARAESVFLFDKPIVQLLENLFYAETERIALLWKVKEKNATETLILDAELGGLLKQFQDSYQELPKLFMEYLDLKNLK